MGHIWFDVTSIVSWSRPPVGIIRMEAECARYGIEMMGPAVQFCRFDRSEGYIIVEASEVMQVLDRLAHDHPASAQQPDRCLTPNTATAPAPQIRKRLRALGRRALRRLPDRFRDPVRQLAIATINIAYEVRRSLPKHARSTNGLAAPRDLLGAASPELKSQLMKTMPFARGDVYVSLGLDWDTKDPVFIAEQKALVGFKGLFCCYDIIPVKFPHLCVGDVASRFARYFVDIAWCADEMVAISECSKRDLHQLLTSLGAPTPLTTVVKLGTNLSSTSDDVVSEEIKSAATDRFILFVSTIERRKNHETIYRAITRIIDKGVGEIPKIVFVGMPGWGVADLLNDLRFDPRIREKIKILNNVADADLAWLYKNALFTLFPSLYEGWGLGVGESLAAGKFCLCSNAASLPEVGGDFVEYLDPWDVQAWANRLEHYLSHHDDLAERERRIREQYMPPAWRDTAAMVFDRARGLLASAPSPSAGRNQGTGEPRGGAPEMQSEAT